jgi:hypothetical protein
MHEINRMHYFPIYIMLYSQCIHIDVEDEIVNQFNHTMNISKCLRVND